MKKLIRSLLCGILYFTLQNNSFAQNTVVIQHANDTGYIYSCDAPYMGAYEIWGVTTGYPTSDSLAFQIDFGDGSSFSGYAHLYYSNPNTYFSYTIGHSYQYEGNYSVRYKVTGPDGVSDSVIHYNELILNGCEDISGRVFSDTDLDCVFDTLVDIPLPNLPLVAYISGYPVRMSSTDGAGRYSIPVHTGNVYTIQPTANYYTVDCPSSGFYSINSLPSGNNDFFVHCDDDTVDVSVHSYFTGSFTPIGTGVIHVEMLNPSCKTADGQFKYTLDTTLFHVISISPNPDSYSNDTMIWNYSGVNYTNGLQAMIVGKVKPTATNGEVICGTVCANNTNGTDSNLENNLFSQCVTVGTSFDPNNKLVYCPLADSNGIAPISPGEIDYTIHFQNVGAAPALNIAITDTLDSDALDILSFNLLYSSHPVEFYINSSGVLRFLFNNIMLPDSATDLEGSQGTVIYRVKANDNQIPSSVIHNRAHIYFDWNDAVVTQDAILQITNVVSAPGNEIQRDIQVFPNPTFDAVHVKYGKSEKINSIELYNASGRKLQQCSVTNDDQIEIKMNSYSQGFYFIIVKTENLPPKTFKICYLK